MSDAKPSPSNGGHKPVKREKAKLASSHVKCHSGTVHSKETEPSKKSEKGDEDISSLGTLNFSKLLEGVVFVLSGFVNPERSVLRSQALEMGAEYQPDWNSTCTLLVCAFPNTPKFRQVEADCGTIVSKGWISDCYNQKKLVPIESYLMHAGKPWRKQPIFHDISQDQETSPPGKPHKKVERRSHPKTSISAPSKAETSSPVVKHLSPSKLKKWAIDDLNRTISWLESQEERPEPSEIKKIAAEGIIICLEDTIEALKQKQDIRQVTEQWNFVPHVVEELAKLDRSCASSASKEDLYQQALTCKRMYRIEYDSLEDCSEVKKKKSKTNEEHGKDFDRKAEMPKNETYDSDETIEMTEEEIDLAFKTIAPKICK
ncbi:PREDICTED: DNA-repair protein XRCC1 isoform X2 [Nelumbo nucifera]|uniref:DNA-repair protein XRCC1 isoform X2 n=1 Tax=Nelumbo nucifera TaxID=4432 RepID=A0A1U7ZB39_NELNU|nr:PREDICTED: DNA-repair protein XRCC1 isoform X2 [Nelumbo nucifera]